MSVSAAATVFYCLFVIVWIANHVKYVLLSCEFLDLSSDL